MAKETGLNQSFLVPTSARGACRSSAPRTQNELLLALPDLAHYLPHRTRFNARLEPRQIYCTPVPLHGGSSVASELEPTIAQKRCLP
ncbi:hypothetical protein TNCV_4316691 [Trichonephila clavipes]|nr:hypothetical protein TNCV_4316691 [Trichonephila clavipes]